MPLSFDIQKFPFLPCNRQTFPLEWGVLKSSVIFSVPLSKSFTESGVEELPDLIGIHIVMPV